MRSGSHFRGHQKVAGHRIQALLSNGLGLNSFSAQNRLCDFGQVTFPPCVFVSAPGKPEISYLPQRFKVINVIYTFSN